MAEKKRDKKAKADRPCNQDMACVNLMAGDGQPAFPDEPIDSVIDPLIRFLHVESAGS